MHSNRSEVVLHCKANVTHLHRFCREQKWGAYQMNMMDSFAQNGVCSFYMELQKNNRSVRRLYPDWEDQTPLGSPEHKLRNQLRSKAGGNWTERIQDDENVTHVALHLRNFEKKHSGRYSCYRQYSILQTELSYSLQHAYLPFIGLPSICSFPMPFSEV